MILQRIPSTNGETTHLTTITYRYSCHLCVSYRCHTGSYRCHICSKSCTAKDCVCINSDDDVHDDSDFGDDSDEDCHDNSDLGDYSDDDNGEEEEDGWIFFIIKHVRLVKIEWG